MKTQGVSPKAIAAVLAAVLGYLATQQIMDLPTWADLIIQVGLVAVGVVFAPPGNVVPKDKDE